MKDSYKRIRLAPGVTRDEHRLVIEGSIGRTLHFNEVVHHIDGNKKNNDLSNLEVISRSDHSRMHQTGTTISVNVREKIRAKSKLNPPKQAKLTFHVAAIRQELAAGEKVVALAKKYGVHRTQIYRLKTGKQWV